MTHPTYSSPATPPVAQLPKRKAGSRFTSGHLLMVVAAMLAFLLSLIVLRAGNSQIVVYVAKEDIIEGQQLSVSQFEAKLVPSSDLNSQYVSKEELTERSKYYASRAIRRGEPLLDAARSPEAEKSGARLQSLPIDKALAVNGVLSRGDRVDVIQTLEEGGCAFRALTNLEVVSAPSPGGGGALGGGSGNFVVTVAITSPSEDLTLAGVIASGSFQVVKTTGSTEGKFIEDPICGNPSNVPGYENNEVSNG